ncbi:DUF1214 domain-containing protein [uncultured Enterovirga sp.]|uniref:DUF1214 domain-containing protein n=1 Tax=uncultured Enterovirga sp. TaxID=2026352 RepID=UPI0035CC4650
MTGSRGMKRVILLALALIGAALPLQAQNRSPDELNARLAERRAVEAVIWGMPAVNYDLMLQEMLRKTSGKVNQVLYWGRPLDGRNQTLTPNPDALYFMVFFNTADGPIVLDLPPGDRNGSFNGNIVTTWQVPLEDAGLLGIDKGKGGKFLILPPAYKGATPAGYIPLPSDTFGGFMLFRANFKSRSEADIAASVAYGKRMKVYPLAQAKTPPPTVFTDAKDVDFDSTICYDAGFFDHLNRIVQSEPWLDRDRVMIDQLRSIGIEKGKPFAPSDAAKAVLSAAAREAGDWLEARYEAGLPPYFSPTSHWTFPAFPALIKAAGEGFTSPDDYPLDDRGLAYSYAFVAIKRLGAGQFYLFSIRDKDGSFYDGSRTYRLRVPPNVPVEQYWSATVYDRKTHALIKNMSRASRASNAADLQKNPDGSTDVYFGPKAPDGKDANWIPTDVQGQFELIFRLYAPTKVFFDRKWVLPDVELLAAQ